MSKTQRKWSFTSTDKRKLAFFSIKTVACLLAKQRCKDNKNTFRFQGIFVLTPLRVFLFVSSN